MATIKRRGGSYLIRCYDGYNDQGKQIERTKTWKIPAGMSDKRAEKEARHQAALFEEEVRAGQAFEGRVKLSEFARRWFRDYAEIQLRPRTVARYRELMQRIDPALGHIYLDRLRPAHLMTFYRELSTIERPASYRARRDFKAFLKQRCISQAQLAAAIGSSVSIPRALVHGDCINADSARAIAAYLGVPFQELFAPGGEVKTLSNKTILHYHRLLSSMLHTAVEWQIIPANPAERVQPPKVQRQEAVYLDDRQAVHLLELLEGQPLPYKTAVETLLFTGMRRGELLGLEWRDIDFEHQTIDISKAALYLPERGLYDDETKTASSRRVIKAPQTIIQTLAAYKQWQIGERLRLGPLWKGPAAFESGKVFTGADGAPMRPDTLTNWFRDFIAGTDLPPIHLHSLRHTNATLQIANGVSVTTVAGNLGHANAGTTTKIYAHAIQSAAAASAAVIDDLLNPAQRKA